MKILLAHNYYQYAGGEDVVFAAERDLLRENGHEVIEFTAHNDAVHDMNKAKLAVNTLWSTRTNKALKALIEKEKPAIAHFHNTFVMMSPSVYYVCQQMNVPVVQTLHNFRLVCANGIFFRDNHVCEDCLGKTIPYPATQHGCYRDSKVQSGVVTTMLSLHNMLGTWQKKINKFIVLTEFARQKFTEAGLPPERIVTKSNFLHTDPGIGTHEGNYAVFVGRLTPEKGVPTMLEAWKSLPDIPLKIVGDGPLIDNIRQFVASHNLSNVDVMGPQPREKTMELMKNARCLVFPSVWYEGMPMTIIEAFASQIPVVASNMGAGSTIVHNKINGLHFTPADPADLAQKVSQLFADDALSVQLGQNARREFEEKYTAEQNYKMMMQIYQELDRGSKAHV